MANQTDDFIGPDNDVCKKKVAEPNSGKNNNNRSKWPKRSGNI